MYVEGRKLDVVQELQGVEQYAIKFMFSHVLTREYSVREQKVFFKSILQRFNLSYTHLPRECRLRRAYYETKKLKFFIKHSANTTKKLTYEYCRASRASPKAHFSMTTKPDNSREGIKSRLPRT